jgi:hypothetical protein
VGEGGLLRGEQAPNYSRFPGDALGLRSELARTAGILFADSPSIERRPHFESDDYNFVGTSINDPRSDPIVFSVAGRNIRTAEISAIAPDLFDATYFSVNPDFQQWIGRTPDRGQFFKTAICNNQCSDYGTIQSAGQVKQVANQVAETQGIRNSFNLFWQLPNKDHLMTGWTHERRRESAVAYTRQGEIPSLVGDNAGLGSRSGYSVKFVSRRFLVSQELPFGGGSAETPIRGALGNPPQSIGIGE